MAGRDDPAPDRAKLDFEAVYEAEFDYVWHTLRRLGADDGDLADLAHDVFLVAYRRLSHYDAARPIRPWLFGISYRVLADERRRGRRKEIPGGAAIEVPDGAPPADEQAVRNQERDVLLRLLASLPIELCAVLVLHDVEGRIAADIAHTLEIPMNTVYSRLRRAREAFAAAADRFRAGGGP